MDRYGRQRKFARTGRGRQQAVSNQLTPGNTSPRPSNRLGCCAATTAAVNECHDSYGLSNSPMNGVYGQCVCSSFPYPPIVQGMQLWEYSCHPLPQLVSGMMSCCSGGFGGGIRAGSPSMQSPGKRRGGRIRRGRR